MWNREPVAIGALVRIVLTLAVSFGLNLTAEQIGLIVSAVALIETWLVRRTVHAPANVELVPFEIPPSPEGLYDEESEED